MGKIPIFSPFFPSIQLLSTLFITVNISSYKKNVLINYYESNTGKYDFSST